MAGPGFPFSIYLLHDTADTQTDKQPTKRTQKYIHKSDKRDKWDRQENSGK